MLLGDGTRRVVLDAGWGYSWTTHWLMMSGFEPIGIDMNLAGVVTYAQGTGFRAASAASYAEAGTGPGE